MDTGVDHGFVHAVHCVAARKSFARLGTGEGLGTETVLYLLPLIWLPVAMWLLWKRHSSGWFMGAAFTVSTALGTLCGLWLMANSPGGQDYHQDLFSEPDLATWLIAVFIKGALVYIFQMRRSTDLFSVGPTLRWSAIGLGLALLLMEMS